MLVLILVQLHAKKHHDADLMEGIMKLVKRNDLPLQAGTADIVFRYAGYTTIVRFKNLIPSLFVFIM